MYKFDINSASVTKESILSAPTPSATEPGLDQWEASILARPLCWSYHGNAKPKNPKISNKEPARYWQTDPSTNEVNIGEMVTIWAQCPKTLKCANGEVRAKVMTYLVQCNLRKRYQNNILLNAHPSTHIQTHTYTPLLISFFSLAGSS